MQRRGWEGGRHTTHTYTRGGGISRRRKRAPCVLATDFVGKEEERRRSPPPFFPSDIFYAHLKVLLCCVYC